MSWLKHVDADEAGIVRLYEVTLPAPEAKALTAYDVQQALNAPELDTDSVEIFSVNDLEEIGLRGYIETGLGIASRDIDPYAERIVDLDGYVVVVLSKAFAGQMTSLVHKHPLRPIGAFKEASAQTPTITLESDAAVTPPEVDDTSLEGKPKKKKSDAAMSGMIATYALLTMFALVGLMIWIAG
jgi:hypothetical protein